MYNFSINGVVDTGQSCMSNLQKLFTACGAWITYDISSGKWSFTIKQAGSSVFDFNDTNIIGGISVSSTGITDLYNKCTISYPHKDMSDKTDQVDVEIPTDQRYADEIDNTLIIQTDLINDPVQAQFMATVELKQNRLDTVIKFTSDYTAIGLKAGDVITVTNSLYGYSYKKFRITSIQEDDTDVIGVSITAMEYADSVYDTAGLIYTKRDEKTGIIPKSANSVLAKQDQVSIANSAVAGLSSDPVSLNNLFDLFTKNGSTMIFAAGSYSSQTTSAPMTASGDIADMYFIAEDNFTPKITGLNIFKVSWNFQDAVCNGSRGPDFNEQTDIIIGAVVIRDLQTGLDLGSVISGGMGAQGWVDYTTDVSMQLVKGHNYSIRFLYSYYSPEKKALFEAAVPPKPTEMWFGVSYFAFGHVPVSTDGTGDNVPSLMPIKPDYVALNCAWPAPGKDFDFKVRMISPDVGMTNPLGINAAINQGGGTYIANRFPLTGTPYMTWGGDSATETPSNECVAVNVLALAADYPTATKLVLEIHGIWGTTLTPPYWSPSAPVQIEGALWKGGTVVLNGKTYTNPTADVTQYIRAGQVATTARYTKEPYGSELGVLMGYFVVDFDQQITYFTESYPL